MCHQILIVAAASAIATVTIITTTTPTHSPRRNETIAVYFINWSTVETKIWKPQNFNEKWLFVIRKYTHLITYN